MQPMQAYRENEKSGELKRLIAVKLGTSKYPDNRKKIVQSYKLKLWKVCADKKAIQAPR